MTSCGIIGLESVNWKVGKRKIKPQLRQKVKGINEGLSGVGQDPKAVFLAIVIQSSESGVLVWWSARKTISEESQLNFFSKYSMFIIHSIFTKINVPRAMTVALTCLIEREGCVIWTCWGRGSFVTDILTTLFAFTHHITLPIPRSFQPHLRSEV